MVGASSYSWLPDWPLEFFLLCVKNHANLLYATSNITLSRIAIPMLLKRFSLKFDN